VIVQGVEPQEEGWGFPTVGGGRGLSSGRKAACSRASGGGLGLVWAGLGVGPLGGGASRGGRAFRWHAVRGQGLVPLW